MITFAESIVLRCYAIRFEATWHLLVGHPNRVFLTSSTPFIEYYEHPAPTHILSQPLAISVMSSLPKIIPQGGNFIFPRIEAFEHHCRQVEVRFASVHT